MKVDMNLLKQLRDMTMAPMKDCKEALEETNGDLEAAKEVLKKKGATQAQKNSGRETKEGVIKMINANGGVVAIKIGCETDFVAKNDVFIASVDKILSQVVSYNKELNGLSDLDSEFLKKLDETIAECVGALRENIKLLDVYAKKGTAYIYNHPGDRLATAVFYEATGDVSTLAKEVALQVASMNPDFISMDEIPQDKVQAMKDEVKQEFEGSNKPQDIIDKIIEGKVLKNLSDYVLLEQPSIRDQAKKVKDVIGSQLKIISFKRMSI